MHNPDASRIHDVGIETHAISPCLIWLNSCLGPCQRLPIAHGPVLPRSPDSPSANLNRPLLTMNEHQVKSVLNSVWACEVNEQRRGGQYCNVQHLDMWVPLVRLIVLLSIFICQGFNLSFNLSCLICRCRAISARRGGSGVFTVGEFSPPQ